MHFIHLLTVLLCRNGFACIPKNCNGWDRSPTTKQSAWPSFGATLALGSVVELRWHLTTELSIGGCCKEPTFYRKSQPSRETGRSCCVKEGKMTLHNSISFGCHSIREAPIYQVFLSFQSLKWLEIVVYLTSNSEASSWTVVRGFASTKALNWSLSTSDGQPLWSSSRLSLPPKNFLNHHCSVRSVVVPGPNALLISQAVSAAFRHNFNWNKKIVQICFFSILYLMFWKEDIIVLKWL